MSTSVLFDELIQLLAQENELHLNLIETAQQINQSIRKDDLASLQKACSIYDQLICSVEQIEEQRIRSTARLQKTLGESAPSPRLTSLIDHCDPVQRKKLEALKTNLQNSITELSKINTSNSLLLQEALGAITSTFKMIKESSRQKNGYRYKGDRSRSTAAVSMFNQVM